MDLKYLSTAVAESSFLRAQTVERLSTGKCEHRAALV